VIGRSVDDVCADPGTLYRDLVGDGRLRRLGPEKGVLHMAIGAVVDAVRDLAARRAGRPLWRLLAEAEPEWLVSRIDFRYLTDALTPDEALDVLRRGRQGAAARTARLLGDGGAPPARGYALWVTPTRRVGGRNSRTYVRSQHAPVSRSSRQVVYR
jgi:L-fuconate dehydratase